MAASQNKPGMGKDQRTTRPDTPMPQRPDQPYHAHVYYDEHCRAVAQALALELRKHAPPVLLVGNLVDAKAGPHPKPQFEVHFLREALPTLRSVIAASGLTALIHPVTADDLADHTASAEWIGSPLPLDLTTLDPPGQNRAVARFGKQGF